MDASTIGAVFEHSVLAGVIALQFWHSVRVQREHRQDMKDCHQRTDTIQRQRVAEVARYATRVEELTEESHRVLAALGEGGAP